MILTVERKREEEEKENMHKNKNRYFLKYRFFIFTSGIIIFFFGVESSSGLAISKLS